MADERAERPRADLSCGREKCPEIKRGGGRCTRKVEKKKKKNDPENERDGVRWLSGVEKKKKKKKKEEDEQNRCNQRTVTCRIGSKYH